MASHSESLKNVRKMIPRTAIPIGGEEVAALLNSVVVDEAVVLFENDLAGYLNIKKTFAFNSGRTALYVAIQALNLKPGEEIIVPAYTCAIVFEVILRLGLKPVLVDVNPETYNLDSKLIIGALTSRTRVVIPVHLFGRPCEMDQIMEIADKHSLYVIENVAQALGAEYKKIKVGTLGDLAVFSFGPGKSLTSGEGGAIAANNEDLIEKVIDVQAKLREPDLKWILHVVKNIVAMKLFSNPNLYTFIRDHLEENLNTTDKKISENCIKLLCQEHNTNFHPTIKLARMPAFSAKIAGIQLKKLDEINEKRIMNAMTLTELLSGIKDHVQLPKMNDYVKNTFTRYPVKIVNGSRDDLMKGLLEGRIDTEKPYHYLVDLFESFRVKAPNALSLAKSMLTLPNHPLLRASDILKIASTFSDQLNADISQ